MSETDIPADDRELPTGSDYVSDRKFADFPLSQEVLKGIADLGYVNATPVQAATLEPGLAGRDLLVRAKTGTGKTAAFCVPLVERMDASKREAQAIVLAPTRELAQQIAEECVALTRYRELSVAVLVGGLAMGPQEKALAAGAQIIVGTPGRVLDHARRKNLDLSTVHVAVLDEADEMLSMGFYEDVTKILDATSADRQVLLFSATISDETQRLVRNYLAEDHEDIRLSTDADQVENIEHILYETAPNLHKVRALLYLLDIEDPHSAIIFCNTREDTATVATFLDRQGLDVQLISGELSQSRRSQVMRKIKAGEVRFLVATDVAARGIDISDLSHVINYSLPQDPAVYLHRTGRTGRIGKKGTAISLVGGTDMGTRRTLETVHRIQFDVRQLPDPETCVQRRVERQARQIRDAMSSLVFESYLPTVRALKERPDGDALLAAALRAFFQWDRTRRAQAADLDTIGALQEERAEKVERKRTRKPRAEKRRPEQPERRQRRREEPAEAEVDLDALLLAEDQVSEDDLLVPSGTPEPQQADNAEASEAADAAPKKRKRRRKKRKPSEQEASPEANLAEPALDDLDALLSAE